jgi:hypothetical protein
VKIGKAKDVKTRVADIQRMSAARLEVVAVVDGYSAEETELHRKYAKYRLHGEWFDLPPDAVPGNTKKWSAIEPKEILRAPSVRLPDSRLARRAHGNYWTQERNQIEWMHRDGLFVTESDEWGEAAWRHADMGPLLPHILSLPKYPDARHGVFRCDRRKPEGVPPRMVLATEAEAMAQKAAQKAAREEHRRSMEYLEHVVKLRIEQALSEASSAPPPRAQSACRIRRVCGTSAMVQT